MSVDIDRLSRTIRNLYNGVFEREAKHSNRVFRKVYQIPSADARIKATQGYVTQVLRDFPTYYVRFDDSIVSGNDNTLARQRHFDLAKGSNLWTYNNTVAPMIGDVGTSLLSGYPGRSGKVVAASRNLTTVSAQSGALSDFSFECLIKFSQNPTAGASIDLFDFGPVLTINDQRKLVLTNSIDTQRTSTNALSANTLYHIVWTRNLGAGFSYLYVNGALVDSWAVTSTSTKTIPSSPKILSQNATLWGGTFQMDEVAVYKHGLTADRVLVHYRALTEGAKAEPVGNVLAEVPPYPAFYGNMTAVGSNTSADDSAYRFAAGVTMQHYRISGTLIVIRLRPRWAYNAAPTNPTIWRYRRDAANYTELWYDSTNNRWTFRNWQTSSGTDATVNGTHQAYEDVTLAFWSGSSLIGVSLNGAPLTTVSNTRSPGQLSTDPIEIGNGANPSNCDIHWMITFGAVLTQSAAERIILEMHRFGNYDPDFSDLGYGRYASPKFLWWGRSAAHQPTAILNAGVSF